MCKLNKVVGKELEKRTWVLDESPISVGGRKAVLVMAFDLATGKVMECSIMHRSCVLRRAIALHGKPGCYG